MLNVVFGAAVRLAKEERRSGKHRGHGCAALQALFFGFAGALEMVDAQGAVLHPHLNATAHVKLVGMQLGPQADAFARGEDAVGVFGAEEAFFAEHVHEIRQVFGGHCGDHLFAHLTDIIFAGHAACDRVGAQEGGPHLGRHAPADAADDAQHLKLIFSRKAVTALDFDCAGAFGHHFANPFHALPEQLVFGRFVEPIGGIEDAPAARRDFGVTQAADLVLELPLAATGIYYMGMGIAECRHDHRAAGVDNLVCLLRGGLLSETGNLAVFYQQPGVAKTRDFIHGGPLLAGSV